MEANMQRSKLHKKSPFICHNTKQKTPLKTKQQINQLYNNLFTQKNKSQQYPNQISILVFLIHRQQWGGKFIIMNDLYNFYILTMNQVDNAKRKITKILQNLAIQLDRIGLSGKVQIVSNGDPYINLQNTHRNMLAYMQEAAQPGQQEQINNNQNIVLDCLKFFINIHLQMAKFSKMLYEGDYSLEIYKGYRKLYEQINVASNCLYQFQSQNPQFLKQKQQLITQNLQVCEQIQNQNSSQYQGNQNKANGGSKKQSKTSYENEQLIQSLRRQNDMLTDMIKQNDEEFTLEIQRYNNTLFDMQETIREYEVRLDKIREYQAVIDDLQRKVIRLKQEKYRDDMLIDNMSKKIRYYQKQRGGIEAFVSPRTSYSRKLMMSPSSRAFNQTMLGNQLSGIDPKPRNYYGQRLASN